MSDENLNLIPPRRRANSQRSWRRSNWRRGFWTWMMSDKPADESRRPSNLQNLEARRGSLPLAQLKSEELDFFELIERGNINAIEKFLNDHRGLDINSVNYKGLNALHIAIKKEYLAVVDLLIERPDLVIRDAALHAVATGNTELTGMILDFLNKTSAGSETKSYTESTNYTADMTPLILAAQLNDYPMVRLLLKRDHEIEKPHTPSCVCPRCKQLVRDAGSMFPHYRLNSYKAICSPAYIVQVTDDPVLYGFLLDRELGECSGTDEELYAEYVELAMQVRKFTVELLSHCRNTTEIELLLQLPYGYEGMGETIQFPRIMLALDYKQKEFVAYPMVQQVLSSYWLGDFIKFPRLRSYQKILHVLVRAVFLPVFCIAMLLPTNIGYLKKLQAPVNRFLLHLASYIVFLLFVFLLNHLDTGNFNRGPPKTGFEILVVIFVIGFICSTVRQFFVEGWKRFISVPWHWYDMTLELLYVTIFILWIKSYFDSSADVASKKKEHERKFWHKYDAALLHEGLFAIATILSFGKLAFYCLQSSRLGPLQVSMGKMLTQIAYFLIFCFLIITSFSIPMARSYAYYTGMRQTINGTTRTQLPAFSTFSNSFSTFFWAMFCMSPVESTDVVVENLVMDKSNPVTNAHTFTEMVGIILFSTYHLIMVIALLNTLIAILSNTFQRVVDNADVEFKFARTKLWTNFFDPAMMVPSPFNLLSFYQSLLSCASFCKVAVGKVPGAKARCSLARCCYIQYEKEKVYDKSAYEDLISNLAQRYFRAKEE